jgi:hypothetical protein
LHAEYLRWMLMIGSTKACCYEVMSGAALGPRNRPFMQYEWLSEHSDLLSQRGFATMGCRTLSPNGVSRDHAGLELGSKRWNA